ncbi:hypothetical protein BDW60DRAFT_53728 [Aspergillus nidulans var. acristatus]
MTSCSGCASLWVTFGRQGDGMRRNKYSVVRPQSNKRKRRADILSPKSGLARRLEVDISVIVSHGYSRSLSLSHSRNCRIPARSHRSNSHLGIQRMLRCTNNNADSIYCRCSLLPLGVAKRCCGMKPMFVSNWGSKGRVSEATYFKKYMALISVLH